MTSLFVSNLKSISSNAHFREIVRYIFVGGLNTILIIGSYQLALLVFNWPWWLASLFCSIIGIGVGFKAHATLVFNKQGYFYRYILNWILNFIINTLAIGFVRSWTGDAWAPIVLLPFTTLSSYFILKWLVFIK